MTAQGWYTFSYILSFLGAFIVGLSSVGIWHFGNKINRENDAKVTELIEGKNKLLEQSTEYLADLRKKDAEIARLKSSVSDMKPVLSLLRFKLEKSNPNAATLILGASYPVDLRQVDLHIEFTSPIIKAERLVFGAGASCNFQPPVVEGSILRLSGGPLKASNYLRLNIQTQERIEIKTSNLKIPNQGK